MHPAPSYELAKARTADLRQAQHDALTRAAAPVPSSALQPDRNRIRVSLRRAGRPRRFGKQLWTLLHAQALLDGTATAAGSPSLSEYGHLRLAARRTSC